MSNKTDVSGKKVMTQTKTISALKESVIFSGVSETALAELATKVELLELESGEVLFNQGEQGSAAYIVVEGTIRAHIGELTLNRIMKNDVLGELAAFDSSTRSATATAEIDTVLLKLERDDLYSVMKKHGDVALALMQILVEKIRDGSQNYFKDFQKRVVLEHELEIGRQIQTSFLPDKLPSVPGWEIAAYFEAARHVAGDFYDAFLVPNRNKIGVVVGDVCDKGVGAALFMALFRSLIRATSTYDRQGNIQDLPNNPIKEKPNTEHNYIETALSQANIKNSLRLTNNYVALTHGKTSMFATLFFGLFDPSTGSLSYVNAGHESLIIFNSEGVVTKLEPNAPAVGLFPNIDFQIQEYQMEPGESLLGFTDGVIDAENRAGERFGEERLLGFLTKGIRNSQSILDAIAADLKSFMRESAQFDDITLVAVKRN